MRNIIKIISFAAVFTFFCIDSQAEINFIVQGNRNNSGSHNKIIAVNACVNQGYKLTSCPGNSFPNKTCNFNGKKYYDQCCDASTYKYTGATECASEGLVIGNLCGGKWSCVAP